MSTTTQQLERITAARNTIRNKLVALGLAESSAKIDTLATAVQGITDNGAVSAEVKEGETYTIPKGYHNGSGTISGVAGGGNYSLQSKTVTPTKEQQNITPDSGKYGLSDVTVAAIPEIYQDVSSVDATAPDVLANKKIVDATGAIVTGTMPNNGAVSVELDVETPSYTVPKGYHDGLGTVKITTEEKAATPTKAAQDITPTAGMVLSKVTVNPIPEEYITTTDATAEAADILAGETAYVNGVKVTGTMPIIDSMYYPELNSKETSYEVPKGYHGGTGSVRVMTYTPDSVTPTKETQVITDDNTYAFMSSVTVNPIPDAYQDVTGVTAGAADVLVGKTIVDATGAEVAGTMKNNGELTLTMDGLTTTSVTIPAGYTTGGTVTLTNDIETALAAI